MRSFICLTHTVLAELAQRRALYRASTLAQRNGGRSGYLWFDASANATCTYLRFRLGSHNLQVEARPLAES